MLTFLCFLGSGLAILALVADILGRHGPKRVKAAVEWLGVRVQFRKAESPVNNLRQFLAISGTVFLAALAMLTSSPVYCALQIMLMVSAVLWYIDVHSNPERSESIKTYVRLAAAIGVWIGLEIAGLCPGFHRLGVIGLELLGCGFIISRAIPRDFLCLAGGVMLATYAGVGIVLEPGLVTHVNWFVLNLIYSALGLFALIDSIRKARQPQPQSES